MAGVTVRARSVTRTLAVCSEALDLWVLQSGHCLGVRVKHATLAPQFCRALSKTAPKVKARRVVYVSKSRDIFENLALEEWLYEKGDLASYEYLLMWQNRPAVVIGRHQNPWTECNIAEAQEKGVDVARRNSGGGTVFHDEGNLNLSFLKPRSQYDRRKNLALVVQALTSSWPLDLEMNCRDDLILEGLYKVSGTASKLGGQRTYHHFTLMLDVDTSSLHNLLSSPLLGVDSRATASVPALVKNLKEAAPDMTADSVFQVVGQEFLKDDSESEKCIHFVDPCDEQRFPGVLAAKQRLRSWEWIFGKTPPFSITRTFVKPRIYLAKSAAPPSQLPVSKADSHISGTNSDADLSLSPFMLTLPSAQLRGGRCEHKRANTATTPSVPSSTCDDCSIRISLAIQKGRIQELSADFTHGCTSIEGAPLQTRLPQISALVGEPLERERLKKLWESVCENVEKERDAADRSLLAWGVECLGLCVPSPGAINSMDDKVLQKSSETVHS